MIIENMARAYEATYSASERKLAGTHYTPDNVIGYIIEKTIGAAIDCVDDFRQFRVIDPACGSGLFLLKAFDAICAARQKKEGVIRPHVARAVLENCLYGIDIDAAAIAAAQQSLLQKAAKFGVRNARITNHFFTGDALDLLTKNNEQLTLGFEENPTKLIFPEVTANGGFDCVVGNPPYIRIQNIFPLERRQKYSNFFQTASGRFDIANLFIELGATLLKDSGRLGFIVSNKLLSTNGARQLRQYILNHFTIEEIIDLADTKLFEAAILPMILILKRGRDLSHQMIFSSATEIKTSSSQAQQVADIFETLQNMKLPISQEIEIQQRVFKVQKFLTTQPSKTSAVWTFHPPSEKYILEKIRAHAKGRLKDIAEKVSVGLKTTADDVFVKPMKLVFIQANKLEDELIFPVLESHNIDRWSIRWHSEKDNFVLYPHEEVNGKLMPVDLNRFPYVKKYLQLHCEKLASRSYLQEAGRQWYEIWVHQSPADFAKTKIITPDISSTNRFALDRKGFFVNGTCFYIILKDQSLEMNFAVLALLNSKLIEYFHKITSGNVLYAKRFRYWTTYLKQYPIPKALYSEHALVHKLADHARRLETLSSLNDISELENEIDRLVYDIFELDTSEINEIEATLK
ncbi:MAG: N-6 DNA methylase [candidate division KSB1 bacterium]|nr:N-6 DNA methylase [candidate division KSB1 bacterium]MDZ7368097.1 N-6 DNA methylase [candidate division KSB1 bacterium]MDZ7405677.1 N-6 DNA methylase [candidate division KSB1 bacterium]